MMRNTLLEFRANRHLSTLVIVLALIILGVLLPSPNHSAGIAAPAASLKQAPPGLLHEEPVASIFNQGRLWAVFFKGD